MKCKSRGVSVSNFFVLGMPKLQKKQQYRTPRPRCSCPADGQRCPPMSADFSRSLLSRLFPVARPYFKMPVFKGGVSSIFFFLQCLINAGAISNYRCKQATISWSFALPPKEWPLFSKLFMFNAIGDLWFLRKSFQNLNWRIRRVPQCLDLKRP